MTFRSAYIKTALLLLIPACLAAQDRFFDYFDDKFDNPLKSFQLSQGDQYVLINLHHDSESTSTEYKPSYNEGIVYSLETGKKVRTFRTEDLVQWIPGTANVLVNDKRWIHVIGPAGDTLRTIDTHVSGFSGIKSLSLSSNGQLVAVKLPSDSLRVYRLGDGRLLNSRKIANSYERPEFTGHDLYIATRPFGAAVFTLWNPVTGDTLGGVGYFNEDSFSPRHYFLTTGDSITHINSGRKFKSWKDKHVMSMDPSLTYLLDESSYTDVGIFDIRRNEQVQSISSYNNTHIWARLGGTDYCAVTDDKETLTIYNSEFGEPLYSMNMADYHGIFEFHPRQSLFFVSGEKGFQLFHCTPTEVTKRFEYAHDGIHWVRFSDSGDYVIVVLKKGLAVVRTRDGNVMLIVIR